MYMYMYNVYIYLLHASLPPPPPPPPPLHQETAIFKLASLQQQLIESVPQSELSKANAQYSELVTKYQHLLQQQSGYVASEGALQRAQTEARTLTEQLESVKQELAVEKLKSGRVGVGSGEEGEGEVVMGRVATLEMKELNERQRADLASVRYVCAERHTKAVRATTCICTCMNATNHKILQVTLSDIIFVCYMLQSPKTACTCASVELPPPPPRCKQLQETVVQLETRNASLEEKFSELTQQLLQTQSREAQLRDQLACECCT